MQDRLLATGIVLLLLLVAPAAGGATASTAVEIEGADFLVNGKVVAVGAAAEGLLLNSRMIQAIFDDENAETRDLWRYPDTNVWDPDRNTREFIEALPEYASNGLRAVTVGLQGGMPQPSAEEQPWLVSGFESDGSLKDAWQARLADVVDAADRHGIVVILSLFYQAQDERLADEGAVVRAVDEVIDWLVGSGHRNVLVEIANESDHGGFDHPILQPERVHELIERVQSRSQGRLMASTSFRSGVIPPDEVLVGADYVTIHGNGQDGARLREYIGEVRTRLQQVTGVKPIVVNEHSRNPERLEDAVAAGASWGYYDQGRNDYETGYQSPPVNWGINTGYKRTFFDRVSELTRGAGGEESEPEPQPPPEPEPEATEPAYRLMVSASENRSDSVELAGGSAAGSIYVWLSSDHEDEIRAVDFYLDGSFVRTERESPFDFAGGSEVLAKPFDTTLVEDGVHAIEARARLQDGTVATVEATFGVDN